MAAVSLFCFASSLRQRPVGEEPQVSSHWLADGKQHGHHCIHACHSCSIIIKGRQIAERNEARDPSLSLSETDSFVFLHCCWVGCIFLRCLNGLHDKLWGGFLGEWVNLCSVYSTGGKSIPVLLNILLVQPQLVACLEIKQGGLFVTVNAVPTFKAKVFCFFYFSSSQSSEWY